MKKNYLAGLVLGALMFQANAFADLIFLPCYLNSSGYDTPKVVQLKHPKGGTDAVLIASDFAAEYGTKQVALGRYDKVGILERFGFVKIDFSTSALDSCLNASSSLYGTARTPFARVDISTDAGVPAISYAIAGTNVDQAFMMFNRFRHCLNGFKMGVYNTVQFNFASTISCSFDPAL